MQIMLVCCRQVMDHIRKHFFERSRIDFFFVRQFFFKGDFLANDLVYL